ncbi:MAG: LL-diaminopimelate aminotransferase, partial [Chlamydiia bacterium]|nr:LL-diaminopimelate aminotransferase [Chlamydiia bacterium]
MRRLNAVKRLSPSYLFPEINRRKNLFLEKNPDVKLTNLGIGDTKLPLPAVVAQAMAEASLELGTKEGYQGYGNGQGLLELREKICETFYPHLSPEEVFISDGAKSDIGRLQNLLGGGIRVGLQDPAYPVYLEGSILQGIQEIQLLPCTVENGFFPELSPDIDLLYICNPNNPTGAAYTRPELQILVDFAMSHQILILYDGAYAGYIQDEAYPQSIYDIPGAEKVAIEINSFSKLAGFTGIRLGWTVIPKALTFDCGHPLWDDYYRFSSTVFNGASNIAQRGGLAVFSKEGWEGIQKNISSTMQNARTLKKTFEKEFTVYGGEHAPYLWVHTPNRLSWDVFQEFLEKR